MTSVAEPDQIVFTVGIRVATKFLVVDFEVGHRSAETDSASRLAVTLVHVVRRIRGR